MVAKRRKARKGVTKRVAICIGGWNAVIVLARILRNGLDVWTEHSSSTITSEWHDIVLGQRSLTSGPTYAVHYHAHCFRPIRHSSPSGIVSSQVITSLTSFSKYSYSAISIGLGDVLLVIPFTTMPFQQPNPRRTSRSKALFLAGLGLFSLASIPLTNAQTGGSFCANQLCVNAVVEQDEVLYQLQSSLGSNDLGWMAVGFGTSMLNSPIVVTWPNAGGSITLSQRFTTARQMPVLVPNPTDEASLELSFSNLGTTSTTITFRHPRPADLSKVNMIYAFSRTRPSSPSPDAEIQRHVAAGTFVLDLTKPVVPLATGTFSAPSITRTGPYPTSRKTGTLASPTSTSTPSAAQGFALSSYQRKLVTHGILATLGFVILLPLGVFIPRYTRTIPALQNKWFTAHFVVQLFVSGPIIFAGWALGYQSAGASGGHFNDTHKRVGLALLLMYLAQMTLGIIIHYFKPKPKSAEPAVDHVGSGGQRGKAESRGMLMSGSKSGGYVRPPQNYLHAILGLAIIALALFNVRQGYRYEFPTYAGISGTKELRMVNSWWLSWVVLIPVIYLLGLTLLPRQYKLERNGGGRTAPRDNESDSDLVPMSQSRSASRT